MRPFLRITARRNYLAPTSSPLAAHQGRIAVGPDPHTSTVSAFFGTFYPAVVRGDAYLASHQGAEAAGEFRGILSQPGLLLADPVGPTARLQLARAYRMQGDTAKARQAFRTS